jgi:hypothetical protein
LEEKKDSEKDAPVPLPALDEEAGWLGPEEEAPSSEENIFFESIFRLMSPNAEDIEEAENFFSSPPDPPELDPPLLEPDPEAGAVADSASSLSLSLPPIRNESKFIFIYFLLDRYQ